MILQATHVQLGYQVTNIVALFHNLIRKLTMSEEKWITKALYQRWLWLTFTLLLSMHTIYSRYIQLVSTTLEAYLPSCLLQVQMYEEWKESGLESRLRMKSTIKNKISQVKRHKKFFFFFEGCMNTFHLLIKKVFFWEGGSIHTCFKQNSEG